MGKPKKLTPKEAFFAVLSSIEFSFKISWKASKPITIVRMIITLFGGFVPLVQVWIGKEIVNTLSDSIQAVEKEPYIRPFVILCLVLVGVQIFNKIISVVQELTGEVQKDLINKNIDCEVMSKVDELDISYFDSSEFYQKLNIAKRDAGVIPDLVWCTTNGIMQLINIIISFAVLIQLHPIFPILIFAACIPSFYTQFIYTRFLYRYGWVTSKKEWKYGYIYELFIWKDYAKEVKLYEAKDHLMDEYTKLWKESYDGRKKIILKFGKRAGATSALPEICKIGVQFVAALNVLLKKGTIGEYTYYIGMVGNAINNSTAMLGSFSTIIDMNRRITNYKEFMAMESNLHEGGSLEVKEVPTIEFKDVSFCYPYTDKYILKNISFKIHPGEHVAFVGLNGAGKTTLTKLLMRFYEPTSGEILLNGIDIHEYDNEEVRKMFGSIFQDFAQFHFKTTECVGISEIERVHDLEGIKEACEKSGANEFIERWENGYDTYLSKYFSEDGEEVSGGQWQKLALASAFFKNSKLIVLDEPTSNLDPIAEFDIFNKIADLSEGKSVVLISHRLSSVTMVDTIFVIDDGVIVERGSHKELMENKGAYSELFNMQAEKYVAS